MATATAAADATDPDQLKRVRRPLRSLLVKRCNEIQGELQKDIPDKTVLQVKLDSLRDVFVRVETLDQQILTAMATACADDEIDVEVSAAADYEERFRMCKIHCETELDKSTDAHSQHSDIDSVSTRGGADTSNQKRYKLPKIELKKFDGRLKNWLGFWAQFSKIHDDETLHDADKFQYLIQSMEKGTEPEELLASYPVTAGNYLIAVSALKERYGRDNLLLQVYVRDLLKLVISNATQKDQLPLDRMYLKLESHLRALNSLNLSKADPATWLFPLVESSLPEDTLRAWQRSPQSKRDNTDSDRTNLDDLMDFLKAEVQNEQQIILAKSGFQQDKKDEKTSKAKKYSDSKTPTAAGLHAMMKTLCIFCDKGHDSKECMRARSMTLAQKMEHIKSKGVCLLCFRRGHRARECKSLLKCMICSKKHSELMCPDVARNKDATSTDHGVPAASQNAPHDASQDTHSNLNCTSEVLLQTLRVDVVNGPYRKTVRALFDSGSQRSYISRKTATDLNLRSESDVELTHILFGGKLDKKQHKEYHISLQNSNYSHTSPREELSIIVLDQQQICGNIPRMTKGRWMSELKQKKIYVNDLGDDSAQVDLLIGADYYGKMTTGRIHHLSNGLTAIETQLGWTISGRCNRPETPSSSVAMNVLSMYVTDATVPQLWDLEAIGIRDPVATKMQQERDLEVKEHLVSLVKRDDDGRYVVPLPWIDDGELKPKLVNNRSVAERRLEATTKKLSSNGLYKAYDDTLQQWEAEGFIEKANMNYEGAAYYLPHRAVIKADSTTTPIRPVFDASSKTPPALSLNDCLEKGPNLIQLLPSIILRFRKERIGFVADIRKAFQMIEVAECDRDFLRFLWWKDFENRTLQVYRHKRVVFGVNCSPFILSLVIEMHLTQVSEEDRPCADKLLESFYVDDCAGSVDSAQDYELFRQQATRLMSEAGMELRQWAATVETDTVSDGILYSDDCHHADDERIISVLGLKWDRVQDSLFCDITPPFDTDTVTKRTVLSVISSLFDPIGFTAPVFIFPKLLLQQSWMLKLGWDDELCADDKRNFRAWQRDLSQLNSIHIPRHMTTALGKNSDLQLHAFSDASQDAYAAVIFLRASENESVSVQLLLAKSRIAPLTRPTIPRLELLGCLIATRLMCQVKDALSMYDVPTYFWTDSTTALAWIKRDFNWNIFVRNRVEEIRRSTTPTQWRHVPGELNPADLPSRGCTATLLLQSQWWEGPDWLSQGESCWPSYDAEDLEFDEASISTELKKTAVSRTLTVQSDNQNPWYAQYFSSFMKNVIVIAWVKRFIDRCRKHSSECHSLTAREIESAEKTVFRLIQADCFDTCDNISGLKVQKDDDGLMRVSTKLIYRDDTESFRRPVVLPKSHPVVYQLIRYEHLSNGHAGVQFLMSHLRQKVWIIQSRRAIRRVIHQCQACRRHSAKSLNVEPAALPPSRVQDAVPFQVTGIDLAGPLYLKRGSKAWIVLFTCAVYRCVHLDYVLSLSTEAFLAAFHRFICCRGRPTTIYSDNGSNLRGADHAFRSLDWQRIQKESAVQRMQWIFNPPTAAWWGGWWERLIRTVKDLLKRMLGRDRVDAEGLRTCLATVESAMNQRPLTVVSEDSEDLIPLTPAMFLRGIPGSGFPEYEAIEAEHLRHLHRDRTLLQKELRSRFRNEYLSQLVQRGKEMKSLILRVGDVVLIGQDNRKRIDWPLGLITELHPGRDGKVRVARVKTMTGELTRPVQRLFPLELSSSSDLSEHYKTTRTGRVVQLPSRYRDN